MQLQNLKQKLLLHRDYAKFSNETFINFLKIKLGTKPISPYENKYLNLYKICRETLNKYAPRKRKTMTENQSLLINKEISKTIMKKTRLFNKVLKHKAVESRQEFAKQRNYCISLLINLNMKDITNNKKFRKTIKLYFSDKTKSAVSITSNGNKEIVEN